MELALAERRRHEHFVGGCVYLRHKSSFIARLRHCSRRGSVAHLLALRFGRTI